MTSCLCLPCLTYAPQKVCQAGAPELDRLTHQRFADFAVTLADITDKTTPETTQHDEQQGRHV